jgi:hypothetical protein
LFMYFFVIHELGAVDLVRGGSMRGNEMHT